MIKRTDSRQRSLFLFQLERGQLSSSAWRQSLEEPMKSANKNKESQSWNAIWNEVIVCQTEKSLQVSAKTPEVSHWLDSHAGALFRAVSKITDSCVPVDDMSLTVGIDLSSNKGGRSQYVIPTFVVRTPKKGDEALWLADSQASPSQDTLQSWAKMIEDDIVQWHLAFNPLETPLDVLDNQKDLQDARAFLLKALNVRIESPGRAMPLKGAIHRSNGHPITPLARLGVVISVQSEISNLHVGKLQGLGYGRVQSKASYTSQRLEYKRVEAGEEATI